MHSFQTCSIRKSSRRRRILKLLSHRLQHTLRERERERAHESPHNNLKESKPRSKKLFSLLNGLSRHKNVKNPKFFSSLHTLFLFRVLNPNGPLSLSNVSLSFLLSRASFPQRFHRCWKNSPLQREQRRRRLSSSSSSSPDFDDSLFLNATLLI